MEGEEPAAEAAEEEVERDRISTCHCEEPERA